jgi:hypothetical protein
MFLDRCRVGPVHISWSPHPSEKPCGWKHRTKDVKEINSVERYWRDMLSPGMLRIQSISFTDSGGMLGPLLRSLRGPFPLLSKIRLSSATVMLDERGVSALKWNVQSTTPPKFPALRSLDLDMVHIPLNSGAYQNLVHLRLHRQWITTEPSVKDPSMVDFVFMLENCPGLEYLDLKFPGPRLPRGTVIYPDPARIVNLPTLRELRVEDKAIDIGHLLAHMSFPSSTQLFVRHTNRDATPLHQLVPAVIPRDRANFQRLAEVHSLTYNATPDMAFPLNLRVSIKANKLELEFCMSIPVFSMNDDYRDHAFNFLFPFLSELSSPNAVEEFEVECHKGVYMHAADWEDTFPQIPSLRVISYRHVQDPAELKVGLGLCEILHKEWPNGGLAWSNLERLVLRDIDFKVHDWTPTWDRPNGTYFRKISEEYIGSKLVDCLRFRASRGHRLQQLKIEDARNLKEETIESLRKCVDTLEWSSYTPPS